MKNLLFLLVFCLTSTLFVYGQTYSGRNFLTVNGPSFDLFKSAVLTKTSKTTFTLTLYAYESDGVDIKHLICDKREPDTNERRFALSWLKSKLYGTEEAGSDYFLITEETEIKLGTPNVGVAYFSEEGECIWRGTFYKNL